MYESAIHKLRILRLVLCILLVLSLGGLLAFGLSDFSADTFTRSVYNILHAMSGEASEDNQLILGSDDMQTEAYKDGIVRLSRSVFSVYSSALVPYSSNGVTLKNPALSACGDTLVVFDRGGTNVYVFDSFNQICSFSSPQTIYNVDVSEEGKIALVTSQIDYRGAVTVYARNGKGKTVTWNCADCYLFDASFSQDSLYVVGFKPDGESTDTVVYQLNAENGREQYHAVIKDRTPLAVQSMKDGSLCVVCTYGVWTVYEGIAREIYRFAGEVPSTLDISDGYIAFSLPGDTTGTEHIVLFDHHGNLRFDVLSTSVIDLDLTKDKVYALTKDAVMQYDTSGNVTAEYETDGLVLNIHTDGTHLFFVSSHEVTICQ